MTLAEQEAMTVLLDAIRTVASIGHPAIRLDTEIRDLLDSARYLEVAGILEERFACEFSANDLDRVKTVHDMIALIYHERPR